MADEPTNWENYRTYAQEAESKYALNNRKISFERRHGLRLDDIASRLVRLGCRADEYNLRLAHGGLSASLLVGDFNTGIWSKYEKLTRDVRHLLAMATDKEKESAAIKALMDCSAGLLAHVSIMREELDNQLRGSGADLRWGLDPRPRVLPNRRQTISRPLNWLRER